MKAEYVAGFFDGEGCLMISRNSKSGTYRALVSMGQKTPEVLRAVQKFIGVGNLGFARRSKSYYLRISRRDHVRHFLGIIRPHAIVKKQHILVMDQFLRFEASRKDPKADQRRANLQERIRELNSGPRGIYRGKKL